MAEILRPDYEDDEGADDDAEEVSTSRLRAYLELFRLPNVFTAIADVLLGFLVVQRSYQPGELLAELLAASSLLYLAGMVLNDLFDRDLDASERPERPIPSGRISPRTAAVIGFAMLVGGTALGWSASFASGQLRPGLVATLLAVTVLAYDRFLKRTPLGPLAMGACRTMNVLLGMSAGDVRWQTIHWLIAGGVGLYIVGVTWFARAEADRSNRPQLALALLVMLAGLGVLSQFPAWGDQLEPLEISAPANWRFFWGLIALMVSWRCLCAIFDPSAELVQMAVRNAILSLIVIDAASSVPFAFRIYYALAIVILIVPATALGRWIYST